MNGVQIRGLHISRDDNIHEQVVVIPFELYYYAIRPHAHMQPCRLQAQLDQAHRLSDDGAH